MLFFLTKIFSHDDWDLKISRIHPGFGFFFFFEAVRESPTHAAPSSSRTRRFFKWGTPRTRPRPLRCISSSPTSRSQACPPLPCWAESLRWWWCPRPGPRPRAWSHRALSFPHRAPPLHRVEAFLLHATREDILTTRWRKGEKLLPWWIGTISCEKTSEWRPVGGTECPQLGPPPPHLAPSFFEKVQIGRSGGPEFWVIRKVRDPQDLIFKTQDLWFQPLIEVLSLHCPPILNFPCAGIPESPKMYQPRQNHHIPQMNKNSSYVKKI